MVNESFAMTCQGGGHVVHSMKLNAPYPSFAPSRFKDIVFGGRVRSQRTIYIRPCGAFDGAERTLPQPCAFRASAVQTHIFYRQDAKNAKKTNKQTPPVFASLAPSRFKDTGLSAHPSQDGGKIHLQPQAKSFHLEYIE